MSLAIVREESTPQSSAAYQQIATLRDDLSSLLSAAKGAGQIGYSVDLGYPNYTPGGKLNALALMPEDKGAAGDGTTDDWAVFTYLLAKLSVIGGGRIVLGRYKRYRLSKRLVVPSNCGIVGDGTSALVAKAADFNNTNLAVRYTDTSAVIDCSGLVSGPYTPSQNIELRGFKIDFEVLDGRIVDGIVARNAKSLKIIDVEITGFSVGCGIRASSLSGRSVIADCWIHDATTALNTYASQPQITGIEIDGDRVNGAGSTGWRIVGNKIEDITMTGSALSTYGMQTDGINIQGSASVGASATTQGHCSFNIIRNVGEGIDHWGTYCTFAGNQLQDCYEYGLKLIYGASFNSFIGGNIKDCGRAGVVIAGSNAASITADTERNTFVGLNIVGTNPLARALAVAPNIYLQDGSFSKPKNNTFTDCSCSMGANGTHGWYDSSTGDRNLGSDMRFTIGGSLVKKVFVNGTGGAVRLAGSPYWITDSTSPTVASASSISPRNGVTFISGTTAIATINVPEWISDAGGEIVLIPTGLWTTTNAGNIALGSTAVVGKALRMTWDPVAAKWYPSY